MGSKRQTRSKASALPHNISLVFDGGSRGNPGPAYGSFLLRGAPLAASKPDRLSLGYGTNNEAEYQSLIFGLQALQERLMSQGIDPKQVSLTIHGDSQLVLSQLSGEWKAKDSRMRGLRDQALALLATLGEVRFVREDRWRIVEVLGH
ncbi:MAG: ribonuclease HI family protein [Anaerolineales bacterium]